MKVYEIIAERLQVNETVWGDIGSAGWNGIKRIFTGGAERKITKAFVEQTSDDLAKEALRRGKTPEKIIADNIASDERRIQSVIDQVAKKKKKTISREEAIEIINKKAVEKKRPDLEIDERWRDPAFQKNITDAANKKIKNGVLGTGEKLAAGAAGAGVVGGVVAWASSMGVIQAALVAANIIEFYQPYKEFAEHMESASQHRQDNSWSPEQYQSALNQETMILVTRWAELVIMPGIIKKLFGFVGNTFTLTASGRIIKYVASKYPKFASTVDGMTNLAFRDWLNHNDNAKLIAVSIGSFLAEYVPSLAEVFETAGSLINPWFPSDPNPASANSAGAPADTTKPNGSAAVTSTSDATDASTQYQGKWHIDPLTGKNKDGRQFYDKNPNAMRNWDITDWVTGPGNNFIQDPKNPGQMLAKPVWWHVDPQFLTKDQLRLQSPGDD